MLSSPNRKPHIIFFTGASGAGKTTLLNALRDRLKQDNIEFINFDTIGVPSKEEMETQFGSGEMWQKVMLFQWIERILRDHAQREIVILDGQVNLDFIEQGCEHFGLTQYTIVLVHCDDQTRHERLREQRKQKELINSEMDNWSRFLKRQAQEKKVAILDTSGKTTIAEEVAWFNHLLGAIQKNVTNESKMTTTVLKQG